MRNILFIGFVLLSGIALGQTDKSSKPVALVTGASRGLGFSITKKLSEQSYTVYAGVRSLNENSELNEFIRAYRSDRPINIHPILLDVTDEQIIQQAISIITENEGRIDILINNAGLCVDGSTMQVSVEQAKWMFDVNVFGYVRMHQATLPIMLEQGSGRVIFVSSRSAIVPNAAVAFYAASKIAVEALMESELELMRRKNIHLSVMQAGPMSTAFNAESVQGDFISQYGNIYASFNDTSSGSDKAPILAQDPDEVANLIAEVLRKENPNFRYQSTDIFRKMAEKRYSVER